MAADPAEAADAPGRRARYGPAAAVLGAAEGIGAAFADRLAAEGFELLLVDRAEDPLVATAAAVGDRHGVRVEAEVADLADAVALDGIARRAAEPRFGLVVCNAAVSFVGRFVDQPLATALAQVDVNCRAPLVVAHRVVPAMRDRGRGGLVILSSMSALRGAPLVGTYAATKAFDLVLAESLWAEVAGDGVDVLAVLPGQTRTPGMLRSEPSTDPDAMLEPAAVVDEALGALGVEPSVIVGAANRDGEAVLSSMGRAEAVRLMHDVMRQLYPGPAAGRPAGTA